MCLRNFAPDAIAFSNIKSQITVVIIWVLIGDTSKDPIKIWFATFSEALGGKRTQCSAFLPTPLSIHLYNYDSNIKYLKQLLCYLRLSETLANKSLGFVSFIWLVQKDFKHRLNVC